MKVFPFFLLIMKIREFNKNFRFLYKPEKNCFLVNKDVEIGRISIKKVLIIFAFKFYL